MSSFNDEFLYIWFIYIPGKQRGPICPFYYTFYLDKIFWILPFSLNFLVWYLFHVLMQSVLSLPDQIKMFKDYIENLKGIAGEERAAAIISDSIYISDVGIDDIINNYFALPIRRKQFNISSYTDFIVNLASEFYQVNISNPLIYFITWYLWSSLSTIKSACKMKAWAILFYLWTTSQELGDQGHPLSSFL